MKRGRFGSKFQPPSRGDNRLGSGIEADVYVPDMKGLNSILRNLRRYAFGLSGSPAVADDLVTAALRSASRSPGLKEAAALHHRLFIVVTDFNRMRGPSAPCFDLSAGLQEVNRIGLDWLAKISLPEREAVLLVVVEGVDYAAASDILDVSVQRLIANLDSARKSMDAPCDVRAGAGQIDTAMNRSKEMPRLFRVITQ